MNSRFSGGFPRVRIGLLPAFLAFQAALLAQALTVTAVLNDATGEARLSPGVLARVYFAPIIPDDHRGQAGSVEVDGLPAYLHGVPIDPRTGSLGYATVLLPREIGPGLTTLVLTTKTGRSEPFEILLDSYSPGLYAYAPDNLAGTFCAARPGMLRLNAVGLGLTAPFIPTFSQGVGQLPFTTARPTVTIANRPAEVVRSILSLPLLGLYQPEIKPALDTPEGLQPLVLTMEGRASNTVNVLVGTSTGSAAGPAMHAAPDSLAYVTGCMNPLATGEFSGDPRDPPITLGCSTVKITDAAGAEQAAPIVTISRGGAQYIVPSETAIGPATVTITSADGGVSSARLNVATVEAGLFSVVCGPWCVAPEGFVVRVRDGVETIEPLVNEDREFLPIDLGAETDQVYLVMLGTGFRHRSSLESVKVDISGTNAPVEYAGPQGEYAGIDQVKVRLPRSLAGASDGVWIGLSVDGKAVTSLMLYFQ